ncbi:MAG: (d)CMP kinase, partial [Verrucomicrobiota bacterium]
ERRRAAEGMRDLISSRDRMDSTRSASPIVCPPGATRIDNTELELDAVVDRVAALVAAAADR